ncbi:hypothetical protein ACLMJK_003754 [Lecanora helva]
MIQACDALTPDQEILPSASYTDGNYHATAVTAALGDTAFTYGMQRICGCTWLYVVSHLQVYLAHYWEDISFGKEEKDTTPLQFQEQVLDFLDYGYQPPNGQPLQPSLRSVASKFIGQPGLQAAIYSPEAQSDEPNAADFLYNDKVQLMAQKVSEIINQPPQTVRYKPVDAAKDRPPRGPDMLGKTAAGHMIFQYDPMGAGSRGKPNNAWRIMWERGIIAGDVWAPSEIVIDASITS